MDAAAPMQLDEPDEGFSMLHELLDEVDGPLPATDPAILLTRKNATIATLQDLLGKLRPMGEQVGTLEQACHAAGERARTAEHRLDGALQRIAELEQDLQRARHLAAELAEQGKTDDELDEAAGEVEARLSAQVEKLEKRLREREGVLARERKRHAKSRALLKESRALAAERWREIQRLRAQG
jgi:hypothetical protein